MTATETTENGTNKTIEPQPEAAHTHEHDHDHEHSHAPTLNPELMREVEVEAPAEEVSKAFEAVVKRFRKLARIPGFRAGKVPESLIRTKFAQDIRQEVLEGLVTERFRQAMEERKLNPISQPQLTDLQLFDGQPLKFKAAFEVAPEINVAGYESVKVAKPDVALTDKEFEAELDHVLDRHATVEPVEEDR
ncbi:MAG: trigger factor, partial [Acidobacteriaceae bacterium]|nr:trigger factor [Acidobacteriaceae bacterium]